MTLSEFKTLFRRNIKVVGVGPADKTRGAGMLVILDALATAITNLASGGGGAPTMQQVLAVLKAGSGITLTPDGNQLIISSTVTAAPAPGQPAAPTAGQVDDTGDTFSFLPNPAYPAFAQHKVAGLPGVTGAVVLDATNSYVSGGRVYIHVVGAVPIGGLAVYVAGSGNIPDGKPLVNNAPFTGSMVAAPTKGYQATYTDTYPAAA